MSVANSVLPQHGTPTDTVVRSVEWLFEPYWQGDRLLARVSDGRVTLTDAGGYAVDDEYPDAVRELEAAILAGEALVDGVWTAMPFVGDGGDAARWADTLAEEGLVEERPDPMQLETRRAFVAVDLLELDGQPLYDIPLLERRRLLTAIVSENVRVRISPAVKLPVRSWVEAWRRSGFLLYMAKHQNSRYHPGVKSEEWLILSAVPEATPVSIFGRLLGERPKKVKHIEDV